MADITEISRQLSERAQGVAEMLLPTGKLEAGKEWVVGNTNGDSGKSCKVRISGSKAGVWKDFATGQTGDLLDLWKAVKGVSLRTAVQEAKEYLGIVDRVKARPNYSRPKIPEGSSLKNSVASYLIGRKLELATINAFQVVEHDGCILFPYYRDGELIMHKHLALKRDASGKKKTWTSKDSEKILFGWQAVDADNLREITICEGEIDCMSLYQIGKNALSVPYGAGVNSDHEWIENEWPYLEQFETIYICMDMDEVGKKAAKEIANRLGLHRCKIVNLPYKDPNECLKKGVAPVDIYRCFSGAEYLDPDELKRAGTFVDAVIEKFHPPSNTIPGFDLPWPSTHGKIRILPGEVSIWSGYNGAGKSLLLGQVMSTNEALEAKSCIASLEMAPFKTLHRIVKQFLGDVPPIEYIQDEMKRLNKGMWLFDLVGTGKRKRMMEVFSYAYMRYGITQFIIDSLAKIDIAEDDYAGQKALIEQLCDFSRKNKAHVHLVAHARKGRDEYSPPRKMDIKGTGAITDMVDNVYIVYRNKAKYRDLAEAKKENDDRRYDTVKALPDTYLICDKCRENGSEAERAYGLYFDRQYQIFNDVIDGKTGAF